MPGRHELIVALGERRYRVERPFGAWPANAGFVTDVAVDGRGHVFVGLRHDPLTQADDPRVIELDPEGRHLAAWGGATIADTHLLTIAPDGRLLVVDRDMHEIVICTLSGQRIGGLGGRGLPLQPFNHPSDVAVSPSGGIFVSDGYAAHVVHRFDAAGGYRGAFGGPGREAGRFMEPHALWAFGDGRIAVVDRCNDRVQVFTESGDLQAVWEDFYRPVAIWGDADGNAYVSDSVPRLHMVDAGGRRIGLCRPVLNGAHGIFGNAGAISSSPRATRAASRASSGCPEPRDGSNPNCRLDKALSTIASSSGNCRGFSDASWSGSAAGGTDTGGGARRSSDCRDHQGGDRRRAGGDGGPDRAHRDLRLHP